jgi:hypothetical protein
VDLHIKPAYELARLEKECGIESSFLILTNADGYNPLSQNNRVMLREMADWGFDIGLHFDPTIYPTFDAASLQKHVDFEATIISDITGKPVRSISLHNPSIYNQYPLFEGYVNAYSDTLFSNENYISDSCMSFRDKDVFTFFDKPLDKPYQLLLHPLHFSENGQDYNYIFTRFAKTFLSYIESGFRQNRTYNEQVKTPLDQQFSAYKL